MYPTLQAALQYGERGFRVLPLKPGTKIPDLRHWPEEASSDAATIERQFGQAAHRAARDNGFPNPNVGICTGNGLAVLDIDVQHGGKIPTWAPPTLTALTPSGGTHLYYAVDGAVLNSVGRIAPGVDVRGERGQVVAPPSSVFRSSTEGMPPHTLEKTAYRWLDAGEHIIRIDASLLTPDDLKQNYEGRTPRFQWRDEVPVGQRNSYLTSLGGHLIANGESKDEVFITLHSEAARLGFAPREGEVTAIVRSVARYAR